MQGYNPQVGYVFIECAMRHEAVETHAQVYGGRDM